MPKNVLITGGTGFLGVHLARHLLKRRYKLILLDIAPLTATDLKERVIVGNIDVRNKGELMKIVEKHKPHFVVHAAAALPIQNNRKIIFDTNVNGTKNILDCALKNNIKRLVFISSTAVYGVPKHLPETETAPIDPIGHYGESKKIGEELCLKYQKKGLQVNILRPKTFLGPERLGVFTLWFEAIFQNKPVFILGKGSNLYQLLDVQDLCKAIEQALLTKASGEIFNIGAKEFGTWRQDLGALIKHAKSKSKIAGFPVLPSQVILGLLEKLNLSPIAAWHYKTLPVDSYVSIEKAQKFLGYEPQKSNKKLLIESYNWYKINRNNFLKTTGTTHRTVWNFKILNLINRFI